MIAREIDLETHIQDVTQVIEYEDLQNVVLVGHSYGGMVVSGIVEAAGRRIGHVVYLDAFLPEDAKAVADYVPCLRPGKTAGASPSWGPLETSASRTTTTSRGRTRG